MITMEKVVHNVFRVLSFILMALAVVFIVLIWMKGDNTLKNDLSLQNNILNPFAWITYIAFGITFVLAVVFPIFHIIQNPRNTLRSLLVVAMLVVIGLAAWFIASDSLDGEVLQKAFRAGDLTAAGSKRVGAALNGTYILGAIAVIVVIYSAIASVFKK